MSNMKRERTGSKETMQTTSSMGIRQPTWDLRDDSRNLARPSAGSLNTQFNIVNVPTARQRSLDEISYIDEFEDGISDPFRDQSNIGGSRLYERSQEGQHSRLPSRDAMSEGTVKAGAEGSSPSTVRQASHTRPSRESSKTLRKPEVSTSRTSVSPTRDRPRPPRQNRHSVVVSRRASKALPPLPEGTPAPDHITITTTDGSEVPDRYFGHRSETNRSVTASIRKPTRPLPPPVDTKPNPAHNTSAAATAKTPIKKLANILMGESPMSRLASLRHLAGGRSATQKGGGTTTGKFSSAEPTEVTLGKPGQLFTSARHLGPDKGKEKESEATSRRRDRQSIARQSWIPTEWAESPGDSPASPLPRDDWKASETDLPSQATRTSGPRLRERSSSSALPPVVEQDGRSISPAPHVPIIEMEPAPPVSLVRQQASRKHGRRVQEKSSTSILPPVAENEADPIYPPIVTYAEPEPEVPVSLSRKNSLVPINISEIGDIPSEIDEDEETPRQVDERKDMPPEPSEPSRKESSPPSYTSYPSNSDLPLVTEAEPVVEEKSKYAYGREVPELKVTSPTSKNSSGQLAGASTPSASSGSDSAQAKPAQPTHSYSSVDGSNSRAPAPAVKSTPVVKPTPTVKPTVRGNDDYANQPPSESSIRQPAALPRKVSAASTHSTRSTMRVVNPEETEPRDVRRRSEDTKQPPSESSTVRRPAALPRKASVTSTHSTRSAARVVSSKASELRDVHEEDYASQPPSESTVRQPAVLPRRSAVRVVQPSAPELRNVYDDDDDDYANHPPSENTVRRPAALPRKVPTVSTHHTGSTMRVVNPEASEAGDDYASQVPSESTVRRPASLARKVSAASTRSGRSTIKAGKPVDSELGDRDDYASQLPSEGTARRPAALDRKVSAASTRSTQPAMQVVFERSERSESVAGDDYADETASEATVRRPAPLTRKVSGASTRGSRTARPVLDPESPESEQEEFEFIRGDPDLDLDSEPEPYPERHPNPNADLPEHQAAAEWALSQWQPAHKGPQHGPRLIKWRAGPLEVQSPLYGRHAEPANRLPPEERIIWHEVSHDVEEFVEFEEYVRGSEFEVELGKFAFSKTFDEYGGKGVVFIPAYARDINEGDDGATLETFWMPFDEARMTHDQRLMELIAEYDPGAEFLVFMYLVALGDWRVIEICPLLFSLEVVDHMWRKKWKAGHPMPPNLLLKEEYIDALKVAAY